MNQSILIALNELSKDQKIVSIQELSIHADIPVKDIEIVINELEEQGKIKVLHRSFDCPIAFELL